MVSAVRFDSQACQDSERGSVSRSNSDWNRRDRELITCGDTIFLRVTDPRSNADQPG